MEHWISNHIPLILEIIAVIFGILYLIFAIFNSRWCWFFGFLGSLLSIYIFIEFAKLYAEALLYFYYVITAVLGWIFWNKKTDITQNDIVSKPLSSHFFILFIGIVCSFGLYWALATFFPEAQRPLFDSFTTIFSFIATWLTVKKWIENWLYWIVINAGSSVLYYSRGLEIYAILMILNGIMAIYGYFYWSKLKQNA